LTGESLRDEWGVEVGELAGHIHQAVGIAELEEGGKVACEASGLINKKIVEVAVSDQSLGISKEVVIEVHGVNHGVEALAESVVVVLETNDSTEEEGFPWLGVDGSVIDDDVGGTFPSASCGIIIWWRALTSDIVCSTAHWVSEVSEAVSVLTVKAHLDVTESVLSEVTVAHNCGKGEAKAKE